MDNYTTQEIPRILLVNDEPQTQEITALQLRNQGYDVLCAQSDQDPLDLLHLSSQPGQKPIDLVLLYVTMPTTDRFEVLRRIRSDAFLFDMPVLIVMPDSAIENKLQAYQAGANDCITRPFDYRELAAKVQCITSQQKTRKSLIQANKGLEALQQSGKSILSTHDLSKVLEIILEQLSQVIEIDSASIILQRGQRLEIAAHKGFRSPSQMILNERLDDLQHIQKVIKDLSPEIIPDTITDPRWFRLSESDYIRSWLGAPLVVKGKAIGVLSLDKEQPNYYTEQHKVLATSFAAQAAVAIENARLFKEHEETKEELNSLISSSFDAVIAIDANKKVTVFNQQAEDMFGYTAQEIKGSSISRLYPDISKAREIYQAVNEKGSISNLEISLRHKNGKLIPVRLSAKLIRYQDGRILGQATFIKSLLDTQLLEERLQALITVSKAFTEISDQRTVLIKIIETALVAFPNAHRGSIHLYNTNSNRLDLVISNFNYSEGAIKSLGFHTGEGIAGWVYEHNLPLVISDTLVESRYKRIEHPEVPLHKSLICTPLRVRERVIGVLTLSNLEIPEAFTVEDLGLLFSFADYAAAAIENANQIKELQREKSDRIFLQEISTIISAHKDIKQVLLSIVEGGRLLIGVEMAVVHLVDHVTGNIEESFAVPEEMEHLLTLPRPKEGFTAKILLEKQPVIVTNTLEDDRVNPGVIQQGIHSFIGYPLISRGNVIGALFLNSRSSRYFEKREVNLISLWVAQAAVAIENARAFQSIERSRSLSEALVKVSHRLTETFNLEEQLEQACQFVLDELKAPMFFVGLYDEFSDSLNFPILVDMGERKEVKDVHLKDEENWGLAGFVIKKNSSIEWFTLDQKKEALSKLGISPIRYGEECQTCLVYPLVVEGRVIGVISVQSQKPYAWGEIEVGAIRALASQVAVAIQKTHLLRESQEGKAYIQAAYEASKEIIARTNPEEALQSIVNMICEVMGGRRARAILIGPSGKARYLASAGFEQMLDLDTAIRPDGVSNQVVRSGYPRFFSNIITEKNLINPIMIEQGTNAAACLPLQHKGKNLGVLWVHYQEPHHFTETEKDTLRLYANQAAITYVNARYMQELNHMHQAAKALAGAADLPQVLTQIVEGATKVLGANSAAIWSYDDRQNVFIPESSVSTGIPIEIWEEFRLSEPQPGQTAFTVMERNWVGVSDVSDQTQYPFLGESTRRLLSKIKAKSFQGMVLSVENEKLGVLYINYDYPRDFDEEERQTIWTFGNHAALALKKARLLEQVNRARDTARTVAMLTVLGELRETLNSIVEGTCKSLNCDVVTLYTYDDERNEFDYPPAFTGVKYPDQVLRLGYVDKSAVIYRIIKLNDLHITEDTPNDPLMYSPFTLREEVKSSVGIPLIAGRQKVGVMFVNFRSHHHFTSDEITNIRLFSDQAAVAIHNAYLYEQSQKEAQGLNALYNAGKAVAGTLDRDEIVRHIVEKAYGLATPRKNETKRQFSHLAWVEGKKLQLIDAFPKEILPKLQAKVGVIDLAHDLKIGIAGRVVLSGEPKLAGDTSNEPDYVEVDSAVHSQLSVPIKINQKVVGVISVEHPDKFAFEQDDQDVLGALASYAAIAIQNSMSYEELKKAKEDLEHTQALVTARTAVAWIGMASSAWRHANQGKAITIKEEVQKVLSTIPKEKSLEEIAGKLTTIERLATEIIEEPVTTPLGSEETVESVAINRLLSERLKWLWENPPYQNVELEKKLEIDDAITVRISSEWLRRALDILIDNSIAAMSSLPAVKLTIWTYLKEGWVCIQVTDIGTGIPEVVKLILFKQAIKKPKGSKGQGVGLLMAQTIVQAYGGDIQLVASDSSGTSMLIRLPLEG